MKILHTSDLHLGKKLNGYDLYDEQKLKLDQIVSYIKANHIDVLLLAGDIYDTQISTDEAIKLFNNFLSQLIKIDYLSVFVISGNHDSRTRLGYKDLFKAMNSKIHFYTTINDIEKVTIEDVTFSSIPFLKLEDINDYYKEKYETLEEGFKRVIKELNIDKTKKNICISHQACNPVNGKYIESDSEVKQVGGEDVISTAIFEDFSYVALGHIHMPQKLCDNCYYSGSIYKYHHNEAKQDRHFLVYDTDENKVTPIDFKNICDVVVFKGYYNDLKSKISNDYSYFCLLDDEQILNAADGLKLNYPKFLGLEYNYKKSIESKELVIEVENKTLDTLFSEFYEKMNDKPLTEEQKVIINKLLNKEEI